MAESTNSSTRARLLSLQKATYDRLQDELKGRLSKEGRKLRIYRRRYDREVRNFSSVSSKLALIDTVIESQIVFCGDFHTLEQSQRTAIKILREVVAKRPKIILALEMVPEKKEKLANDYVKGAISEADFLEGLAYQKSWGFPWEHYKPIFDFATEHQLAILALNALPTDAHALDVRDDLAADRVAGASLSDPEALVFVLYGDLHLAEPHIPRRVERRLASQGKRRKIVTIFQNSEPIYWKLAESARADSVDVVLLEPRVFCVLSVPPWIKWQSYLSWLEDESDLLADPDEGTSRDYYHQVLELARKIDTFLGLKLSGLDHFSVYTAGDISVIDELDQYCAACLRADYALDELIRNEIVENRSAIFPEHSILYLSDLSQNRAAERASQLVASKNGINDWVYGKGTDVRDIFYRLVLWEAIGFFGSKIINPKRKCDYYRDFEVMERKTRVRALTDRLRDQREVALAILSHRTYELKRLEGSSSPAIPRKLFRLPPRNLFGVGSALGKILANRLYSAVTREDIPMNVIRVLYAPLSSSKRPAEERYFALMYELGNWAKRDESKLDRF